MFKTIIVATALVSFTLVTFASQADDVGAKARAAFEEGKGLFHDKKYAEAATAFRLAYELKKTWKLLFNIGQSEAASNNHGLALEAFEHYLSQGGDEVPKERQQYVLEEISRLRKMVGILEIQGEDGDVIEVNGKERGALPDTSAMRVAMGKAEVRVTRGDQLVYDRRVEIFGGKTSTVRIPKTAPQDDAKAEPVSDEEEDLSTPEEREENRRVWTWVAFGIGGASAISAGITGGLSLSKRANIDKECNNNICPERLKDDEKKVFNLAVTTDVLVGVAAIGIGTGILLYFYEPKWFGTEEIAVVPTVGSEQAGLAITGRF